VVNLYFIKEIIRSGALISKKSMLHFFIIFITIPQTTFKKIIIITLTERIYIQKK
jgi:hypothetical protein